MQKTENLLEELENLILKEKFNQAIIVCDRLLKLDKKNFLANATKANLLAETGFHKEAILYYQKALQIKPNDPAVLFNLATTLYDLDRYEEAIQFF